MLRASIIFFVLGLFSLVLGLNSFAGLSIDIGKILLFIFCLLSVVSFLLGRSGRKSKGLASLGFILLLGGAMLSHTVHGDDTLADKAKEAGHDTKRAAKEVVRVTKDRTCSMVKGKLECAAEKAKHEIQRAGDKVEDAMD